MAPKSINFTKLRTVTLLVGKDKTPFEISSHIVERSTVLRKRLETYKPSESITMFVSETSPELMKLYLGFIHTGPHKANLPDNVQGAITHKYKALANIYVVAKNLDDFGAKNDVVTAMLNLSKIKDKTGVTWPPDPGVVRVLYENTSAGSSIRQLVTDLWIPIRPHLVEECIGYTTLPQAFLKDIINAIERRAETKPDGLIKVLAALMKIEDVQKMTNAALVKGSDAYMES